MGEDNHLLAAVSWLLCGILVGIFTFTKIGGANLFTKGSTFNVSISQQTQMGAVEVDLATTASQRLDPLKSRVPASKSDRLE